MNKPRIGDAIQLKDGREGVVQAVLRARDVLNSMEDLKAMRFGTRQIAMLGPKWLELYFRVAVTMKPGEVEWFEWNEVEDDRD